VPEPGLAVWLSTEENVRVFAVGAREDGQALGDLAAGERIEFSIELVNSLTAGRYHLGCSMTRGSAGLDVLLSAARCTDFVSYGYSLAALVGLEHQTKLVRARAAEAVR
jgi:hypothetical protein